MANCSDSTYVIYYTDSSKGTIQIAKSVLDVNRLDIALIGKTRIEYGEIFNENLLHVLENFAAPSLDVAHNIPNASITNAALLERPTVGQFWFNTNFRNMYVRSPDNANGFWKGLHSRNSLFGISGTIQHGETIPVPAGTRISDCSFTVSPFFYQSTNLRSYNVSVDANGVVTALYVNAAGTPISGLANFMALVIFNNTNNGTSQLCDAPPPMVTPTSTVTPSVSEGSPPVQPSLTPTPTVTATITLTPTPGASVTPTPQASVTPTPGASVTPTPQASPSPVAASATPQPTVTPTPTAEVTPTSTPQPTVTPTPSAASDSGNLIPFGLQEILSHNSDFHSTGIVFNGFTNNFIVGTESTRYHFRLETNAFDVAASNYVDMGAVIGDEPSNWQNEYWVLVTGGANPGPSVTVAPGSLDIGVWTLIGPGVSYQVSLQTDTTGNLAPAADGYALQVWMQRSVTAPVDLSGATDMGTLSVTVSSNDPV